MCMTFICLNDYCVVNKRLFYLLSLLLASLPSSFAVLTFRSCPKRRKARLYANRTFIQRGHTNTNILSAHDKCYQGIRFKGQYIFINVYFFTARIRYKYLKKILFFSLLENCTLFFYLIVAVPKGTCTPRDCRARKSAKYVKKNVYELHYM